MRALRIEPLVPAKAGTQFFKSLDSRFRGNERVRLMPLRRKHGLDTNPRKRGYELLSCYYGNAAAVLPAHARSPSVSLSLGCDDGEVLPQPVRSKAVTTGSRASGPATGHRP